MRFVRLGVPPNLSAEGVERLKQWFERRQADRGGSIEFDRSMVITTSTERAAEYLAAGFGHETPVPTSQETSPP